MEPSHPTPPGVPRRSGLLALSALLLATAGGGLAMGVFLYVQLRQAELGSARSAARNAELERNAQTLTAQVETLALREQGLNQRVDELGSKQRARDAALAERTATLDGLGTMLQALVKRGDALLQEAPDALEVHLTERALFLPGSAHLSASGGRLLRQLGDGLSATHFQVEVAARGPSLLAGSLEVGAARARLAAERAASASVFLVRKIGLPDARVSASVVGSVRRRTGDAPLVRRSCLALRLVAPLAELERPVAAAYVSPPPAAARP